MIDPGVPDDLLGHGDGQRQQPQAGQGVPQGSPGQDRRDQGHPPRGSSTSTPSTPSTRKAATTRPGPKDAHLARPGDDRPGVPQRPRRPRLDGDGRLATSPATIGSRQAVDTVLLDGVLDKIPAPPRRAPLPRSTSGTTQKAPRAEKAAALYAKHRTGDRPRLAHARPHLHRTEAIRRRRLPAGGLGPGRPRLHDPRPGPCRSRSTITPTTTSGSPPRRATSAGRKDAIAVARNLVEQPRDPQKNGPNDGGSAQRSGRLRWAEIAGPSTSSGTT